MGSFTEKKINGKVYRTRRSKCWAIFQHIHLHDWGISHTVRSTFVSSVVEVCRLRLEPMCDIHLRLSSWKRWRWPDRNFLRCKKRWKSLGARSGLFWMARRNFCNVSLCAFKNFVRHRTSQSAGAGIWDSIFNRCNDATVRTQKVPLVHASCDVITLSRTWSRFKQ